MIKNIISTVIFLIIFTACTDEATDPSPLTGWWKVIKITTLVSGAVNEIEIFPTSHSEDRDGDGYLETITFSAFIDITTYGSSFRQKIYIHVTDVIDPDMQCNCFPQINYVGHCTEMDMSFRTDGSSLIYSDDSRYSGTAPYTLENNTLTITAQNEDGSNEVWEMNKLGSAPLNPDNAGDQNCD